MNKGDLVERRYLLVKLGLYYRPDSQGYTGIKEYAGRYLESDAMPDIGVVAIHENEAPEYSAGCFSDLMAKHSSEKVRALEDEIARLREALEVADAAIKEWFRYLHGGEMRGSYDGKPEREQLRKAGYVTTAALQHKEPQG